MIILFDTIIKEAAVYDWKYGMFHSLTCGNSSGHAELIYKDDLLFCTDCGYTQEIPDFVISAFIGDIHKQQEQMINAMIKKIKKITNE